VGTSPAFIWQQRQDRDTFSILYHLWESRSSYTGRMGDNKASLEDKVDLLTKQVEALSKIVRLVSGTSLSSSSGAPSRSSSSSGAEPRAEAGPRVPATPFRTFRDKLRQASLTLNPLMFPPRGMSGVEKAVRRKKKQWNKTLTEPVSAEDAGDGEAPADSGKGKEKVGNTPPASPSVAPSPVASDSDSDGKYLPSPVRRTRVVLPVKELPCFEGTKKDDMVTFIWQVDKIAVSAQWLDEEWVLNVANLVGGCAAPLVRWIRMGLSVGQPINQAEVVHNLMETYGNGQTSYAAYKKLKQCCQRANEKVGKYKLRLEELFWTIQDNLSKLAKIAKFVSGLLPSLNKKLRGKEYNSFLLAVKAAQIKERCLEESGQQMDGGDQEQQGKEQPWTRRPAKKYPAGKPEQKAPGKTETKPASKHGKGCWKCGKGGHIAAKCPEQSTKSTKQLLCVNRNKCPRMTF